MNLRRNNFANRLGDGANVYLTSAEPVSVGAVLGKRIAAVESVRWHNRAQDHLIRC